MQIKAIIGIEEAIVQCTNPWPSGLLHGWLSIHLNYNKMYQKSI
jgi:hypothetical protein